MKKAVVLPTTVCWGGGGGGGGEEEYDYKCLVMYQASHLTAKVQLNENLSHNTAILLHKNTNL